MRPAVGLLMAAGVALTLAAGCSSMGMRSPFGGSRSSGAPDSTRIRARLQDERLQRLEDASTEEQKLLRRNNAEQAAQLETLLAEVRAVGERLTTLERRLTTTRYEPPAVTPAAPAAGAPAPEPQTAPPASGGDLPDPPSDGQELYQSAYQDLMADNYQLALSDFRAYLERYPRTNLADNAQYWIGEVYYEQKQYGVAVEEFRKVVEEYPGQDKAPAAYYKMALCFRSLRDNATAKRYLDLVIERFPDSHEADLAKERRGEF
jgi:tol-pal system protein YbgF